MQRYALVIHKRGKLLISCRATRSCGDRLTKRRGNGSDVGNNGTCELRGTLVPIATNTAAAATTAITLKTTAIDSCSYAATACIFTFDLSSEGRHGRGVNGRTGVACWIRPAANTTGAASFGRSTAPFITLTPTILCVVNTRCATASAVLVHALAVRDGSVAKQPEWFITALDN